MGQPSFNQNVPLCSVDEFSQLGILFHSAVHNRLFPAKEDGVSYL